MKDRLLQLLAGLRTSAYRRDTCQGLQVYELAISQLESATSAEEIVSIHAGLKHALHGMVSHGHFTPSEYQLVEKILKT